ncbi:BaiN/RdsA family NAD(P)/FAD-dependent oxidoreductase [Ensifer soli]|uniref:NAD(P)/FAD-dependent oxidoreductase n=1 Tax=Ciceribacter sp. sgz301302 TaxID=3342379 RepID=UPI0035BABFD5
MDEKRDVVILGAGAAGMMAAIAAGRRGRDVLVLDHAAAPGEKIRISGGGRCNFTNLGTGPQNFLSANPHFAKSALARYTPRDFLALIERHGIAWHEKTLGQLFCDGTSRDVVSMLTREMADAGATLRLSTPVEAVEGSATGFRLRTGSGAIDTAALIVATGGKSIPKMGATGFAYQLAARFGLPVVETRPGLVPLTLDPLDKARLADLSGVSVEAEARLGKAAFREALLVTHRGFSGPAILQISSYWREGQSITLALRPDLDIAALLRDARRETPRLAPQTVLARHLPKRLAQLFAEEAGLAGRMLADLSDRAIADLAGRIAGWTITPAGSEGYRTAEVTLGGVDTTALDSRTLAAKAVPGLYFVGECVDVTGWLGGYNFQWAWASGHAAGQAA